MVLAGIPADHCGPANKRWDNRDAGVDGRYVFTDCETSHGLITDFLFFLQLHMSEADILLLSINTLPLYLPVYVL